MNIFLADFNDDLYGIQNDQTPFAGGMPVAKKDVVKLDIITGELGIQLITESKVKSFKIKGFTNARAGKRLSEKQTLFKQIVDQTEDQKMTNDEIELYLKTFKLQKRKRTAVTPANTQQIAKDANRTLLRIKNHFPTTDVFEIEDLTPFVVERYWQLNKNVYSNLLNVDQLFLQYIILDALLITSSIVNDYQQGFNDVCGFILSMMIQDNQFQFQKLNIPELQLPSKYCGFVNQVGMVTAEVLFQLQPVWSFGNQYFSWSQQKKEKALIQFSKLVFDYYPHMYESITSQNQLLNVNIFDGIEPFNYLQSTMLNLFTREFSMRITSEIHQYLNKQQDKIETCMKLIIKMSNALKSDLILHDLECYVCDSFKNLEAIDFEFLNSFLIQENKIK